MMLVVTLNANAYQIPLADESVQMVCTSPPYWGLRNYKLQPLVWGGEVECEHEWGLHQTGRVTGGSNRPPDNKWPGGPSPDSDTVRSFCLRCNAWRGSLGLEPTPELYVEHLVAIFREVWRVLRGDGTLWLNLGSSYWGGKGRSGSQGKEHRQLRCETGASFTSSEAHVGGPGRTRPQDSTHPVFKPKDLVPIPWMVAMALQADGWWLRSDIIWSKPNPMPESVQDRCTKSHEYVFLLTKSKHYYYDQDAIREPQQMTSRLRTMRGWDGDTDRDYPNGPQSHMDQYFGKSYEEAMALPGRNRRTVWTIATHPYNGAHFATFPPKLIEPMILAGTSAKGACPKCGAAWRRMVERRKAAVTKPRPFSKPGNEKNRNDVGRIYEETVSVTTGWQPTCTCDAGDPIPCLVLDPFAGTSTVGQVCIQHRRSFIGLELNRAYIALAQERTSDVQVELGL